MKSEWVVHKFGGTSVANAERYRAAAEIVLVSEPGERVGVIVSAMSGVTNELIKAVELAAKRDSAYLTVLASLERRHLQTITELQLSPAQTESLRKTIAYDFDALEEVLRGVWITRLPSERIIEFVSGHGEL